MGCAPAVLFEGLVFEKSKKTKSTKAIHSKGEIFFTPASIYVISTVLHHSTIHPIYCQSYVAKILLE
jgi:hypothetical protein